MSDDGERTDGQPNVTRRSVVKASGAAAVLGVAGGGNELFRSLQSLEEDTFASRNQNFVGEDEVIQTVCAPNCRGKCPLDVYVRDGQIRKVQPHVPADERYKRGCVLGMSHTQRIYDPTRIKYPMKRVDWSPDDPNVENRGPDAEFERISWDEALDLVAAKMEASKAEYGSESVLWHAGSGNDGIGGTVKTRLAALFGGTTDGFFYGIDTNVGQGFGRVAGNLWGAFLPPTNAPPDWKNNRTMIFWGTDLFRSQHQMDTEWVHAAREAGSKWICIDPMYTTTAAKADLWLPIKPGKDAYLALAMMQSIFAEGTYDAAFLRKRTLAPGLVRQDTGKLLKASDVFEDGSEDAVVAYNTETDELEALEPETDGPYALFGEFTVDGVETRTALTELREHVAEYTPEAVGDIAGLQPDDIRTAARWLATRGAGGIMPSYGIGRYLYGHVFGQAYAILMALTGDYGNPGNIHNHHINIWGGNQGLQLGDYTSPGGKGAGDGISSSPTTGVGYKDLIKKMEAGEFNVIYAMESNMLGNNFPDRQRWLSAMEEAELIVWADMHHTTSVQHSDIVLPVTHWFEKEDVVAAYSHPHIMYRHKVQEPLWESKSDYWIFNQLAERFGFGDAFLGDKRAELRKLLEIDGRIDFDELYEQGTVVMPHEEILYQDAFGTGTGRLEIYDDDAPTETGPGIDGGVSLELPEPLEARTADDYEKASEYPLVFMQKHALYRIHSQYEYLNWVREIQPEPTLDISPADAEARGIADGDYVRVRNDLGTMVVKAKVNSGIQPGLVNTDHGWWARDYLEGHHNDLTDAEVPTVGKTFAFYDTRVEVEPAPEYQDTEYRVEEPAPARMDGGEDT